MFEVMLIGLLVLVLILIPLCIGFVAIVRWIMRRTRGFPDRPRLLRRSRCLLRGLWRKGVVRTESLTAEDTFALETSGEQGLLQKRPENLSCPWRMLWRRRTIRTRPCCRIN